MTAGLRLLDHLVDATRDLASSVAGLEERLGAPFSPVGSHREWGTCNAILPLGSATYLEVIGPDPAATGSALPVLFGIAASAEPRLATWSAKGSELARFAERARSGGVDLGTTRHGSRRWPDGTLLAWEMTGPSAPRRGGIVPFFIDWGNAEHPALAAAAAPAKRAGTLAGEPAPRIELLDLRAEHPEPARVAAELASLGVDLAATRGPKAALFATLRTPNGRVELA